MSEKPSELDETFKKIDEDLDKIRKGQYHGPVINYLCSCENKPEEQKKIEEIKNGEYVGTIINCHCGCSKKEKHPKKEKEPRYGCFTNSLLFLALGGMSLNFLATRMQLFNIESAIRSEPTVNNLFGDPAPEKYYHYKGDKVFLEIDGKSIEQYVQEKGR